MGKTLHFDKPAHSPVMDSPTLALAEVMQPRTLLDQQHEESKQTEGNPGVPNSPSASLGKRTPSKTSWNKTPISAPNLLFSNPYYEKSRSPSVEPQTTVGSNKTFKPQPESQSKLSLTQILLKAKQGKNIHKRYGGQPSERYGSTRDESLPGFSISIGSSQSPERHRISQESISSRSTQLDYQLELVAKSNSHPN